MKAKLVEGQSYWVQGIKFVNGEEREVTKELAEYLEKLPNFEVTKKTTKRTTKKVETEKAGE